MFLDVFLRIYQEKSRRFHFLRKEIRFNYLSGICFAKIIARERNLVSVPVHLEIPKFTHMFLTSILTLFGEFD